MIKDVISYIINSFGIDKYLYSTILRDREYIITSSDTPKIFFFMVPNYGNIGDQAITSATISFLHNEFPNHDIVFINLQDTYTKMYAIKKIIRVSDIVILQGGGNMGNLYQYIENYRRYIIKQLPNNIIISMPVTCTFTKDKQGEKELKKSRRIYNSHKRLLILAREKRSYEFIKKEFIQCRVLLCPDIVFYLADSIKQYNTERTVQLLCFRHDKESKNKNIYNIIEKLFSEYTDSRLYDTVVFRNVPDCARNMEIESVLRDIMSAKVVITDRMHAMILSAITQTPCVVLNSLDGKIEGSYEWIKSVPFIKLIDKLNLEKIKAAIDEVLDAEVSETNLQKHFKDLSAEIRQFIKNYSLV